MEFNLVCQSCGKRFLSEYEGRSYCDDCVDKRREMTLEELSGALKRTKYDLVCDMCNKEYKASLASKYCSKECVKARAKLGRDKNAKIYTKLCERCGKEYKTIVPNQHYCSGECRRLDVHDKFIKIKKKEYKLS